MFTHFICFLHFLNFYVSHGSAVRFFKRWREVLYLFCR